MSADAMIDLGSNCGDAGCTSTSIETGLDTLDEGLEEGELKTDDGVL